MKTEAAVLNIAELDNNNNTASIHRYIAGLRAGAEQRDRHRHKSIDCHAVAMT